MNRRPSAGSHAGQDGDSHAAAPADIDPRLVAALFAVDPTGLGGVLLRAAAGPERDGFVAAVRALLPANLPWRRLPPQIGDSRLLGGLDLTATLRAGRPVAERGLLAEVDGGVLLMPLAERAPPALAARVAAVLDDGRVQMARDGVALELPSRFGVIALDEGIDDERVPSALAERLAIHLTLPIRAAMGGNGEAAQPAAQPAARAHKVVDGPGWPTKDSSADGAAAASTAVDAVAAARGRLRQVLCDDAHLAALVEAAGALGIESLRAPTLALRVARAAVALAGRTRVDDADVVLAAQLVLAPRARCLPAAAAEPAPEPAHEPDHPDDAAARSDRSAAEQNSTAHERPLPDQVLAAAAASIPAGLLALLRSGGAARASAKSAGRSGERRASRLRGRPAGTRRARPGDGGRINLVETLRAAAPWQALRRRERGSDPARGQPPPRVEVRADDFRATRYAQRAQTTTIFAVDASGSAALHRLAEAKGAVELVLADCYVRRDQVALVAFRGQGAETLLPPTRSLVRARRSLAGLPGGGGTPLAAGIEAALLLALVERRRGNTPLLLLLTDGRANVARDGAHGRERAEADALAVARQARLAAVPALLVDTSPRPQPQARALAEALGARYLALPHAEAGAVSRAASSAAKQAT